MPRRHGSLEAARELLPDVRSRTERAVGEVEAQLPTRRSDPRAEAAIRTVVGRWVRSMEAFGLEIKGLWLVDFDNGSGYYCWKWPEEDLGLRRPGPDPVARRGSAVAERQARPPM